MIEPWVVFSLNGKEISSYTVRGTFAGELENTRLLLAADHGCTVEDIKIRIENR